MTDFDVLPPAARLRIEKWKIAIAALEALNPQDAATIAAAVLDVVAAGDPRLDPWSDLRADADFWADCANSAEREAYFSSLLKQLADQPLGIGARKRLLVDIWSSLNDDDRRAFLRRVDPQGLFFTEAAR